jgi:2-C-methyl-D-erythritol 4-phosphate cytidylyltransferase
MKYYAIIVAGGKGNRMQQAVPKQFSELEGLPVLMHTLQAFHQCVLNPEIILVLNTTLRQQWEQLCAHYSFTVPHQVISGGEERFHSVRNGLAVIQEESVVAIHDGVRPLVTADLILRSYQMAEEKGNAVAAIQPVDSVRFKKDGMESSTLNRDELYLIQTPQTFSSKQLETAYNQPYSNSFTDDASVVERAGFVINLLEGERSNIKITYSQDMALAGFLLNNKGL